MFEKRCCPRGQRQAAAMALRAACSEIQVKDIHTHTLINIFPLKKADSYRLPDPAPPPLIQKSRLLQASLPPHSNSWFDITLTINNLPVSHIHPLLEFLCSVRCSRCIGTDDPHAVELVRVESCRED